MINNNLFNFKKIINFETNRLILKPMKIKDSDLIIKWRNSLHIKNFSLKKKMISLEEHKVWFNSTRDKRVDYIFFIKEIMKPIGSLSFKANNSFFKNKLCIEMGKYLGDTDELGKGYAQEATEKWISIGFNFFDLDNIYVITKSDNFVNIHINKKLGFEIIDNPKNIDKTWTFMIKRNEL
jgi:RimJ/RimL family protein N-acetyltransferase